MKTLFSIKPYIYLVYIYMWEKYLLVKFMYVDDICMLKNSEDDHIQSTSVIL